MPDDIEPIEPPPPPNADLDEKTPQELAAMLASVDLGELRGANAALMPLLAKAREAGNGLAAVLRGAENAERRIGRSLTAAEWAQDLRQAIVELRHANRELTNLAPRLPVAVQNAADIVAAAGTAEAELTRVLVELGKIAEPKPPPEEEPTADDTGATDERST